MNYLVVRFLFRHRRLDQIFEGKPTVLIEHGKVMKKALAKELLTHVRIDDGTAPPGVRQRGGSGALRPGAGRHVLHPAEIDPRREKMEHDEVMRSPEGLQAKMDALAQARGQA